MAVAVAVAVVAVSASAAAVAVCGRESLLRAVAVAVVAVWPQLFVRGSLSSEARNCEAQPVP